MAHSKITYYCDWEGSPALLIEFADGRPHGWVYGTDGAWHNGEYGVEVAVKARTIDEASFRKRFPHVGMPEIEDGQIALVKH
ncbi:hypothetical protein SAMN05444161_3106 [Rhizobiales bacterium GAS191]|nr:hypothetical protein SAMN05444161_3106 [Rhizobiales bacterium GAS191]